MDQLKKTLRFWHDIEFFIPFDLQQALDTRDQEWSVRYLTMAQLQDAKPDSLWQISVPPDRKLSGFDLFVGLFDKAEIATITHQIIDREALTATEANEQVERGNLEGKTCFARIRLNTHGEPDFDEVSVSTVPWSLGRVKQYDGLAGLSFDAFKEQVQELEEQALPAFPTVN